MKLYKVSISADQYYVLAESFDEASQKGEDTYNKTHGGQKPSDVIELLGLQKAPGVYGS